MTHAIDTVFIDAILVPPLREFGLPETLPLAKLSPQLIGDSDESLTDRSQS